MSQEMRPLIESTEIGNIDLERIRAVVRAVHISPTPDGWEVRTGGRERVCQLFPTQHEAEHFAHELSEHQGVEVIFHTHTPQKLQ
jgi:hypothetical protein